VARRAIQIFHCEPQPSAAVADRVVVVDRGRVVAEGTAEELRRTLPNRRIEVRTKTPPSVIRALDPVEAVEIRDDRSLITATDSEQVVKALLELDPESCRPVTTHLDASCQCSDSCLLTRIEFK
jgi:ABC-type uncharacterized transport system ATPase subunit